MKNHSSTGFGRLKKCDGGGGGRKFGKLGLDFWVERFVIRGGTWERNGEAVTLNRGGGKDCHYKSTNRLKGEVVSSERGGV